jgi:hypothetical protein
MWDVGRGVGFDGLGFRLDVGGVRGQRLTDASSVAGNVGLHCIDSGLDLADFGAGSGLDLADFGAGIGLGDTKNSLLITLERSRGAKGARGCISLDWFSSRLRRSLSGGVGIGHVSSCGAFGPGERPPPPENNLNGQVMKPANRLNSHPKPFRRPANNPRSMTSSFDVDGTNQHRDPESC